MKKFLLVMMGVMVLFGMNVKAESITVSNNSKDATVAYVHEVVYGFEITWDGMTFNYMYLNGEWNWQPETADGILNKIAIANTSTMPTSVSFGWEAAASYTGVTSTFLNWSATPEVTCEGTEQYLDAYDPVYYERGLYSDSTCETLVDEASLVAGTTYYVGRHTYPTLTSKNLEASENLLVGVHLNKGTYTGTPVSGETIGSITLNFSN